MRCFVFDGGILKVCRDIGPVMHVERFGPMNLEPNRPISRRKRRELARAHGRRNAVSISRWSHALALPSTGHAFTRHVLRDSSLEVGLYLPQGEPVTDAHLRLMTVAMMGGHQ